MNLDYTTLSFVIAGTDGWSRSDLDFDKREYRTLVAVIAVSLDRQGTCSCVRHIPQPKTISSSRLPGRIRSCWQSCRICRQRNCATTFRTFLIRALAWSLKKLISYRIYRLQKQFQWPWSLQGHWQLRCPAPGKGKKQNMWDFSRITKTRSCGFRDEETIRRRPMCQLDFVDYFVNQAPRYSRYLAAAHAFRILDQWVWNWSAASKVWQKQQPRRNGKQCSRIRAWSAIV